MLVVKVPVVITQVVGMAEEQVLHLIQQTQIIILVGAEVLLISELVELL
jgi:hypothetical protein